MNYPIVPTTLLIVLGATTFGCREAPEAPAFSIEEDTEKVMIILKNIDDHALDMDSKMSVYADDVVHMAQGSRAITNRTDLRKVLEGERQGGHAVMKHELITIHSYHDMVLTRGRVKGEWRPNNGETPIPFETNNIITYHRMKDGTLKVWQVIFNRVNLENY